jgi:cephalosporin hydroxylase
MSEPTERTSHGDFVPDGGEFAADQARWRQDLGADGALRQQAVDLQVAAEKHRYTYTWEWLGVPIIRLPDDVVVLQELLWSYRPQCVVETGVARGGSMLLNASLMRLCGVVPRVLGIDHKIFAHTRAALDGHPAAEGVQLHEADSTTLETREKVRAFICDAERAVLVLDSNHTHDHVLAELRMLAPLLPVGSFVLVADTLIEEFPAGHYRDRPWDRGSNPLTAARAFLAEEPSFKLADEWSRRGLLSEFRDGILRRTGDR